MDRCDVLVVGGGPGGSSFARTLRRAAPELDVVVLDRKPFPRDKVCAGWVTPPVLASLEIEEHEYRKEERVLQPIRGFRVSRVGSPEAEADCGQVVSWGIRRCEFDHFLLARSGARLRLGEPLESLERSGAGWLANGQVAARAVVGAGGHFCPVARRLGAEPGRGEPTVVAREIEFEMTPAQQAACPTRPELPELFFAGDLRGYGWVVRKGDWLNVGLGRQDPDGRRFPERVSEFLDWLEAQGRGVPDLPRHLKGHAYLLWEQAARPLGAEGALLVGDAVGLAYARSGEGIRPAVESGMLAARVVADAFARRGGIDAVAVAAYARALERRFGRRVGEIRPGPSDWLPRRWRGPLAGRILAAPWFARRVVVERWFLHRHQQPLPQA